MGKFEEIFNRINITYRDILTSYTLAQRIVRNADVPEQNNEIDERLQELYDRLSAEYHDNSVYYITIFIETFCADNDDYDVVILGHKHDTGPLYVYFNEDDKIAIHNKNDSLISDCIDAVQSCKLEL